MTKCYYGLRNILGPALLQKDTKSNIYKTLDQWCSMVVRAGLSLKLMKQNLVYLKERFLGKFMAQVMSMGYGE